MIGLVLIAAGGALACVAPAQRIIAHQRFQRAMTYGPVLRAAVPIAPAAADLDELVAQLD